MGKNIIAVTVAAVVGLVGCGYSYEQSEDVAQVQVANPQAEDHRWTQCEEEDENSCVWVADEQGNGHGESFVADEHGSVTVLEHDEARSLLEAPADLEEQDWQWEQLMEDEAYHWTVCEDFYETSCVWVASYKQERGHEESFLSLPDGDVIPLNERQALAMVGDL